MLALNNFHVLVFSHFSCGVQHIEFLKVKSLWLLCSKNCLAWVSAKQGFKD
jgi:hypothetical protein